IVAGARPLDAIIAVAGDRQRRRCPGRLTAMAFAITSNAIPLPIAAVPVVEVDAFRRDVLTAIVAGGRLLLLIGLPGDGRATRLLAAIADDARGAIAVCSTDVTDAYPALTPDCPSAHHFEREIAEQYGIKPEGHPWLKPVRFAPGGPTIGEADFYSVAGSEIHEVAVGPVDRKSTRLNSSHRTISYAVFCLKKKKCLRSSIQAIWPSYPSSTSLSSHAPHQESTLCCSLPRSRFTCRCPWSIPAESAESAAPT